MFDGTRQFSELALYYKKNRMYPYQDEYNDIFTELNRNNKGPIVIPSFDDFSGTMQDFAKHWIDIFVNGDSIGDCKITGEHSHYLNCCFIERINTNEFGRKTRGGGFPDFWDEDFKYFWSCDIGKWGIRRDRLKTLNKYVDLNLLETNENLSGGFDILYAKPRGVGAEQPHSEILISTGGEITMGDVVVGTQLYDRYGNITNVTEVLPQGLKDVWQVTLSDGRNVRCGENHLWSIVDNNQNTTIHSTKQLLKRGLCTKNSNGRITYNFKIPKLEPVKFSEKELPIHPYILGCLLGGSTNGYKITSDDVEITNRIQLLLDEDSSENYLITMKDKLEHLKVNINGNNNFIPDIYRYGSVQQRLEIVKGLMDTHGSISKQGYCDFSNKSYTLCCDLMYILRSLGIYCTFIKKDCFRVYIATNTNIFFLPRKANRINITKSVITQVSIKSIEKLDYQEEQSCIIVDNKEHLYLTRDFIVTHNSWKGGAYANYNLRLVPESKTFILADKEEYLLKDGLYSKFYKLSSFINENCWWLRKSFVKESLSEMNFETGVRESIGGSKIVSGFGSATIGIVIDGDEEKARGKRGNFLFEEFGSFPGVDNVWNVTEASVNEYGVIYGQKRGFGTGGDTHGGMVSLEKMVYKPKEYRILEFNNIYEEFKGSICFFTPAYRNITHKDEHGNSNEELGKMWLKAAEDKKSESNDLTEITKFKAEFCSKPGDMFKNAGVNILPVELATECLEFLERTNIDRTQCTHGNLIKGINKVIFTPEKILPYEMFPVKPGTKEGCISIWKKPFFVNGKVPKNLYIVSVDAYTQDGLGGKSIGSVRVFEQPNKHTSYKGDCEVAWYDGRPEGFDGLGTFAANIFLLAEFYNAKISLENDQVGDIISYAKKNSDSHGKKLTMYLAEQFDLQFNEKIATKKSMDRAFGMNMTQARFQQGMKYAQQWLIKPRGANLEGKPLLNIHFIMSRGLLREIKDYNGENADRLSAFIIAMYHLRENEDNIKKQGTRSIDYLRSLKLY